MPITPLPTPPSTSAPTTFAADADAFIAALPVFVTEANAQAVGLQGLAGGTLVADLASTASGKGAAMVGRAATVVSSIAALRALLKTSAGQHAFATGYYAQGDGGGGAYWYDSSDTTSADNGGTIIVATDGGRWKLVNSGRVSIKQFGAKGDGVTDDSTAIQSAIDSLDEVRGGSRNAPDGEYFCATGLFIRRTVKLYGNNNSTVDFDPFFEAATSFVFPTGVGGIWVQRGAESADGGGGDNSIIEDIAIKAVAKSGYVHGVRLTARATLNRVHAIGFSGNGFDIVATAPGNNANLWRMTDCRSKSNDGHGLYVDGADANAGVCIGLDASTNGGWGIYDSSFLGNTYLGCHTASNVLGPYKSDNANASSVFLGCYTEAGQGPSVVNSPSVVIGGSQQAGTVATNNASTYFDALANRCSVSYIKATAAGSGYTSAPTVTIDAPTGAATATATATVVGGVITAITITSAGAGYGANPGVTISDASGVSATAVAQIAAPFVLTAGALLSITVTAGGSGYVAPTVTIDAPTETTATGTAYLTSAGALSHIVVTNRGAGYTSIPAVALTGGAGSGAVATAVLSSYEKLTMNFGGDQNNGDILKFSNDKVRFEASGTANTCRLRYTNNNSGDIVLDLNSGATRQWFYLTGPASTTKFGRSVPVPYAFQPAKFFLSNSQILSATAMPTTGEYAKGDFVFNANPSEAGSAASKYVILGWTRLVTGTAHVLNTDWVQMRCLTGN